ncbi:MAG: class I SAM-dependent methyltransferase [Candidatus Magasanikbacteria bacterium]|nr:class I SAM-dependent methyltransferase [Candidatus Magasanikbacteria bacterium]MCA9390887.1 class I SAM-dependent methyltransferase [Candidatus Magasanikbacteria bacterium]
MKSLTIDTYNAFAQVYDDETTGFWRDFPTSFIDEFARNVDGDVLNIGCGPGRDGLLLEERGLQVTHIDASESMIKLATEHGLKASLGDMLNLQFRADRFAGIWSYTTMLHLPKSQIGLAFSEAARVLKPGGWFALGMQEGEGESYKESSEMHAPRWFALYSREELTALLEEQGFKVHSITSMKPKSKTYLHLLCQKMGDAINN